MRTWYRYLTLVSLVALAACPPDSTGPLPPPPPPPPPQPPAAPTNLVAAATSSSRIDLSWTDGGGQKEGTIVERCTGAGCSSFSVVLQIPPQFTSYHDIDRAAGSSYSYRVRATNQGLFSNYSNTSTAVTVAAATVPAAPSGLSPSGVTSSQVELTWTDNASNEDGFKIERCQGSGCTTFTSIMTIISPNVSSSRMSGLTASTTYRFRVLAYNGAGSSAPTVVVTITTLAAAAVPPAPTNLTATATSNSRITLAWTDVPNEDGYYIERCQGNGCTNFTLVSSLINPNGTTYFDTGLTASTTYTYQLKAYNGAGTSGPSAPATATTPGASAPAAPASLAATAFSSSQINLSWLDMSSNEDGFRIDRCTGAGCVNFTEVGNVPANAMAFQNTGLLPATTYRYLVRAINTAGAGSSGIVSATTLAQVVAPAAPTNLAASVVSSSRIDLSWNDASNNEESFKIDRCTGAGCSSYTEIASVAANTNSYQNTGLTASTAYGYRVRSYNAAGSPPSNTVSATTLAPLATPTLNAPTVSGTSITLTWSFTWPGGLASSNDRYELEASTTSATSGFSLVTAYYSHTTPYTVTLTNRAVGTHYFRVRAFTTQGTTSYSTVRSAIVASATASITIANQLSGVGSSVLRFRVAQDAASLFNAANTGAERLESDSYCGGLPGASIDAGESMTFSVTANAPNFRVYIGLGIWDNSDGDLGTTCWHKKNWAADANFDLLYIYNHIVVTNHSGPTTWTLMYVGNNIVLRTPSGDIPFLVSVNQDPIR
jgi:fibronectin type 3 domain-containing protein